MCIVVLNAASSLAGGQCDLLQVCEWGCSARNRGGTTLGESCRVNMHMSWGWSEHMLVVRRLWTRGSAEGYQSDPKRVGRVGGQVGITGVSAPGDSRRGRSGVAMERLEVAKMGPRLV